MFDQVLWFATRGAGAVSQLMLTASVCFGLITVTRFAHAEWPRFFNYEMHRRISLLSVVFLAVHILAAVFDPFTNLGLVSAIVPLASTYRPVQVALGVVALYLFVALIVTSLLRKHIGERTWRLIHWTSYAMWPLAMLHGITAGTDGTTPWMLAIDAVCAIAVVVALAWRIQAGTPNRAILPEVVAASSMRINGSASSAPDSGRGDRR
jgi:predicted ferric reductase